MLASVIASGWRHRRVETAPLLLVTHANAFFLFAIRFDSRPVSFDDRHVEETVRLLLPNFDSRFIDGVHQPVNSGRCETSTEVTSGRRIRDSFGTQQVQVCFVISPQFDMLETGASREEIEGNVEHMIGLSIRQVDFENRAMLIDRFGKPNLPDQLLHQGDPATTDRLRLLCQFQLR